jgi:hypothetical protein
VLLTSLDASGQSVPRSNISSTELNSAQAVAGTALSGAGTADWNRVRELARDEEIVVNARGQSFRCIFNGATDEMLFCDSPYGWGNARAYRIQRAEVKQIRLEQSRRNMKLAIGATAAAGFIWGAVKGSNPSSGSTYPRVVVGLAGAALGALAGFVVALPAAFIPGRLVYRRASQPHGPVSGSVEARQ